MDTVQGAVLPHSKCVILAYETLEPKLRIGEEILSFSLQVFRDNPAVFGVNLDANTVSV